MSDGAMPCALVAHPWTAFSVTAVGVFMGALDAGVVVVALPAIAARFGADLSMVQWVMTAYLMTITALLILVGRLGDMVSRKTLFRLGFVVFTLGSGLCGAAPSLSVLVAARVLQGVGAALLMALSPALVLMCFPGKEKGRALGLNAMVVSLGLLAGPGLGGLILGALGWPYIFYLNLPVGIAGFLLAGFCLPSTAPSRRERFDFPGAALFVIAMVGLVSSAAHGQDWGWTSAGVLGGAGIGAAALAAFWLREKAAAAPMIDPAMLRRRSFSRPCLTALLAYTATYANTILLPFYLHGALAVPPAAMGLILSILPAVTVVVSPISGWLSERIRPRYLSALGLAGLGAGLLLQSGLTAGASLWRVGLGQMVIGLGFGIFSSPNNNAILTGAPPEKSGVAGGIMALGRNLGMICGIAVATALFETVNEALAKGGQEPFFPGFRAALVTAAAISLAGVALTLAPRRAAGALRTKVNL